MIISDSTAETQLLRNVSKIFLNLKFEQAFFFAVFIVVSMHTYKLFSLEIIFLKIDKDFLSTQIKVPET